MFDPSELVSNGIPLLVLVFGLVEFFKTLFALEGKRVTVLSALMGAALLVAFELRTVLPEPYGQIYDIAIKSLTFGLAASGYYKFTTARLPKTEYPSITGQPEFVFRDPTVKEPNERPQ